MTKYDSSTCINMIRAEYGGHKNIRIATAFGKESNDPVRRDICLLKRSHFLRNMHTVVGNYIICWRRKQEPRLHSLLLPQHDILVYKDEHVTF